MSDSDSLSSDPQSKPPSDLSEEQAAAILAAKPLAPKPRPAFSRKKSAPAAAGDPDVDLSAIPEAVPLDEIPEGIPLDEENAETGGGGSTASRGRSSVVRGPRPLQNRAVPPVADDAAEPERRPLDKSRFVSFEQYSKGETPVRPLEKAPGVESRQVARLERPKFLDGELPRRVERGVQYPMPGRVLFTSVALLLFKLSLVSTIIGLTVVALIEPDNFVYVLWLPISLVVFGILFLAAANRTRCRICSCHLFYNRRCYKHQKAHRLFGFGHAGSAALHALLFRWLRCMYCGTAIRLRPAKDADEAVNRPAESRDAEFDKSLIKPRAPKASE